MTAFALLFTLAAVGVAETVYLIRKRRAEEQPVCIIGDDCHIVLSSKYNRIFGIHNDVAGLAFYLASLVFTAGFLLQLVDTGILTNLFGLMLAGASVFSLILVFIQWKLVKAWCFWCLMSSITNWLMTAVFVLHLYYPNIL